MQDPNQQRGMLPSALKRPSTSLKYLFHNRHFSLALRISFLISLFSSKLRAKLGLKPLELNEGKKGERYAIGLTLLHINEALFCIHVHTHNLVITQNWAPRRSRCWPKWSTPYRSDSRLRSERSWLRLKRNVCSIRNLGMNLRIQNLNREASLRCIRVRNHPRDVHIGFSAKWKRSQMTILGLTMLQPG